MSERSLQARVRGRVQGVGFRWFVQREAARLGVGGAVWNVHDGTVEVEAEGPAEALEALVERLREGPFGSDVSGVEVRWGPPSGGSRSFEIRGSR